MEGSFELGTNEDVPSGDREKAVNIKLTKGFWLAKYPITLAHWNSIVNNDYSYSEDSNYPKLDVNWKEASDFSKYLNLQKKFQLSEQYHFSLPTEVEWEYAAKAGGAEKLYLWPKVENEISHLGWYKENSEGKERKPVGKKTANLWGFYDMIGIASEACQ